MSAECFCESPMLLARMNSMYAICVMCAIAHIHKRDILVLLPLDNDRSKKHIKAAINRTGNCVGQIQVSP